MKTLTFAACALALSTLSSGCGTTPSLTPAREITGTWRTAFPVPFYMETEWCDFETMQLMYKEKRLVTWKITEDTDIPDGTGVNIEMSFTPSDTEPVKYCRDETGLTPDPTLMFFTGAINGAYLTVKKGADTYGEFSFTTSNMEGDWSASTCSFTCQRIYTEKREFKLNKVD